MVRRKKNSNIIHSFNFRYELLQRGVLEPKDVGFVPDAYTCNQHLERENTYLKKEMESYKLAARSVLVANRFLACC